MGPLGNEGWVASEKGPKCGISAVCPMSTNLHRLYVPSLGFCVFLEEWGPGAGDAKAPL